MTKIAIITVFLSIMAATGGILFFCLYNGWVTIAISTPGLHRPASLPLVPTPIKTVTLWYWHKQTLKQEKKELFWSNSSSRNCAQLIEHWLNLLDEEGVVRKPCLLQSLSISPSNHELFISLDRTLYNPESSTYDKWMLTESLLKTLTQGEISFQSMRLLVHHGPLIDNHLDFSMPWPRDGFSLNKGQDIDQHATLGPSAPLTIMIDPAGDAILAGRIIGDSFERGITLQCAESLKHALETKLAGQVRVLLTRLPGETIDHLQNAAFANSLHVNLYLSLNFYEEDAAELPLNIYYFSYNPVGDFWRKPDTSLSWIGYNQAYTPLFKTNHAYAHLLKQSLELSASFSRFIVKQPHGIPCKPLVGILTPALACECGLKNKDDWKSLVPILAEALCDIISKSLS